MPPADLERVEVAIGVMLGRDAAHQPAGRRDIALFVSGAQVRDDLGPVHWSVSLTTVASLYSFSAAPSWGATSERAHSHPGWPSGWSVHFAPAASRKNATGTN